MKKSIVTYKFCQSVNVIMRKCDETVSQLKCVRDYYPDRIFREKPVLNVMKKAQFYGPSNVTGIHVSSIVPFIYSSKNNTAA